MTIPPQLIGAVLLPNLGVVGAKFFPLKNNSWYKNLKKPSLTPPAWVFPVAWTYLYSSMGYASYFVWKDGGGFDGDAYFPLILYGIQLLINWSWGPIFFGAHFIKGSLLVMAMLVTTASATAVSFNKISHTAGLLFVPYILWLGFASILNIQIYQLNKDDKRRKGKKK